MVMKTQGLDPIVTSSQELNPVRKPNVSTLGGNVATSKPKLEPVNNPTLQDFISEAQKLGQQKFQATADIAAQKIPDFADALSRRLVSQNVGASSGIGQQLQERAIGQFQEKLLPYAQQTAADAAEQELRYREANLEDQYQMVEKGQITGPRAEEILRQKGIDPTQFKTAVQAQLDREKEAIGQNLPPEKKKILDTINTVEELNLFKETGQTYEDAIQQIGETNVSVQEWRKRLPAIQAAYQVAEANYERLIGGTSANLTGGDEGALGSARAVAKLQMDKLYQIIADINAGIPPIRDIAQFEEVK